MRWIIGRRSVRRVIAPKRGKTCAESLRRTGNVVFMKPAARARRAPARRGLRLENQQASTGLASAVSMERWSRGAHVLSVREPMATTHVLSGFSQLSRFSDADREIKRARSRDLKGVRVREAAEWSYGYPLETPFIGGVINQIAPKSRHEFWLAKAAEPAWQREASCFPEE